MERTISSNLTTLTAAHRIPDTRETMCNPMQWCHQMAASIVNNLSRMCRYIVGLLCNMFTRRPTGPGAHLGIGVTIHHIGVHGIHTTGTTTTDITITGIIGIMDIIAGAGIIVNPAGTAGITVPDGDIDPTDITRIIGQEIIGRPIQGRKPCRKDRQVLRISIPPRQLEIPGYQM